jgi:putative oxidoreductase
MTQFAFYRLLRSDAPAAVLLVRLAVGWVFLSEGIQKFLYPAALGAGRFMKIGIPWPEVTGPFVGGVELVGGALLLFGLCTRLAALLLAVDMAVAFTSTKIPMLLGRGFWGFAAPASGKTGFWAMAHESRTDLAMLLGALFLLAVGSGRVSLDALAASRPRSRE